MNQARLRDTEQQLVDAAATVLERFRPELLGASLTFKGPEVEVWLADSTLYTSELRITFYRNDDLHDRLEFFLFRDGNQIVSDDEVKTWVKEQLEEIVSR